LEKKYRETKTLKMKQMQNKINIYCDFTSFYFAQTEINLYLHPLSR